MPPKSLSPRPESINLPLVRYKPSATKPTLHERVDEELRRLDVLPAEPAPSSDLSHASYSSDPPPSNGGSLEC